MFSGMPSQKQSAMISGIGGLGAGLANMFGGGGNDPYEAASASFNKIPDVISPYYNPYIYKGHDALAKGMEQYDILANNPGQRLNQIGGAFQQSPGYQFQLQQGMNAVNNAAGAGGMLGTPAHIQNASQMSQGIANQDYYNWLHNALGLYNTGLSGYNNTAQMGLGAAHGLSGALVQNLENQGALKYGSQAAQNQSQGQMWGDIFGGLGSLAIAGGLF